MKNKYKLVHELMETNNFKNKRLAKSISKVYESDTFCVSTDGKRLIKNHKKAYKLLLELLPREVRERVIQLDEKISIMFDYIYRRTGWVYTNNQFIYRDHFQNMHDSEFRSFDTYSVPRGEFGFYLDESNKPEYIKTKERIFYVTNEGALRVLDEYISEKDVLIKEFYELSENKELAEALVIYLGYIKENHDNKNNVMGG